MLREKSQREAVFAMGELAATFAHQVRSLRRQCDSTSSAQQRLAEGSTARDLVDRSLVQLSRLERTVAGSPRVARTAAVPFEMIDLRTSLRRALAHTPDAANLAQRKGDRIAPHQYERPGGDVFPALGAAHPAPDLSVAGQDEGDGSRCACRRSSSETWQHGLHPTPASWMSRRRRRRSALPVLETHPIAGKVDEDDRRCSSRIWHARGTSRIS